MRYKRTARAQPVGRRIDLLTGKVHALVETATEREFIESS